MLKALLKGKATKSSHDKCQQLLATVSVRRYGKVVQFKSFIENDNPNKITYEMYEMFKRFAEAMKNYEKVRSSIK